MTHRALSRHNLSLKKTIPPVWFMRQAGRYLPEYRAVREKAGDFLDLCYNPDLACEVTLQPIRRFDCDAAIIFSDILVVLQALGQKLWFETGEGPRLGDLVWQGYNPTILDPVYKAIQQTRDVLPQQKSLIGFAGAPWTLLLYAIQGKGGGEFESARKTLYQDLAINKNRIAILTNAVIQHLEQQIIAGCDTIQLFDSWSGLCPSVLHHDFILNPTQKIISTLRERHPAITLITFPKGFGDLPTYAAKVKPDVLGIDQFSPLAPALFPTITLQGNLDPLLLKTGGAALDKAIDEQFAIMNNHPYIFNLGHGIDKDTPITHVEHMMQRIRDR